MVCRILWCQYPREHLKFIGAGVKHKHDRFTCPNRLNRRIFIENYRSRYKGCELLEKWGGRER